jgi:hypothetical protein
MTPDLQLRWSRSNVSRKDFACRAFIATWTAIDAILLGSVSLDAAALWLFAILAHYTSTTNGSDESEAAVNL